jgi:hypothetical protein
VQRFFCRFQMFCICLLEFGCCSDCLLDVSICLVVLHIIVKVVWVCNKIVNALDMLVALLIVCCFGKFLRISYDLSMF